MSRPSLPQTSSTVHVESPNRSIFKTLSTSVDRIPPVPSSSSLYQQCPNSTPDGMPSTLLPLLMESADSFPSKTNLTDPKPVEGPNTSKSSEVSTTLMPQLYAHLVRSSLSSLSLGSGLKTMLCLYQDAPTSMLQLYPYYTECQSMSSGVKKKRSPIASTSLIRPRQVPELPAQYATVDGLFNGDATLDMPNSRFRVEVNRFRARIDGMWTSEHRHGSSLYVCG